MGQTQIYLLDRLQTCQLVSFRSDTNLPARSATSAPDCTDQSQDEGASMCEPSSPQAISQPACMVQEKSVPSTPIAKAKKRKQAADDCEKALASIDQELNRLDAIENDEAAEYARAVAAKLRKLTPYQFALARKGFENLLFDIQYGQHGQQSTGQQLPSHHATSPCHNQSENQHSYMELLSGASDM